MISPTSTDLLIDMFDVDLRQLSLIDKILFFLPESVVQMPDR